MIVGYLIVGYLDAGTGSLILQTVLGGAAGLAVFVKTGGRRFFRSKRNSEEPETAAPASERPVEEVAES